MHEVELKGSKKYKGCIRWFKLWIHGGKRKVEKRRPQPIGNKSYTITKEEYDWIDSPKKAENIWAYYHFYGPALNKPHPMGMQS